MIIFAARSQVVGKVSSYGSGEHQGGTYPEWTWKRQSIALFSIFLQQVLSAIITISHGLIHLGIESHFVGVHGPYELHRKEKLIKCTTLGVHENDKM